jgi:hypothetical protein
MRSITATVPEQLRERYKDHRRYIPCECGGSVTIYARNLGRCDICQRDYYVEHLHTGWWLRAVKEYGL